MVLSKESRHHLDDIINNLMDSLQTEFPGFHKKINQGEFSQFFDYTKSAYGNPEIQNLMEITFSDKKIKNIEVIKSCLSIASIIHNTSQRKTGGYYLLHPLETAEIVSNYVKDEYTIGAAILHDTVEEIISSISGRGNLSEAKLIDVRLLDELNQLISSDSDYEIKFYDDYDEKLREPMLRFIQLKLEELLKYNSQSFEISNQICSRLSHMTQPRKKEYFRYIEGLVTPYDMLIKMADRWHNIETMHETFETPHNTGKESTIALHKQVRQLFKSVYLLHFVKSNYPILRESQKQEMSPVKKMYGHIKKLGQLKVDPAKLFDTNVHGEGLVYHTFLQLRRVMEEVYSPNNLTQQRIIQELKDYMQTPDFSTITPKQNKSFFDGSYFAMFKDLEKREELSSQPNDVFRYASLLLNTLNEFYSDIEREKPMTKLNSPFFEKMMMAEHNSQPTKQEDSKQYDIDYGR